MTTPTPHLPTDTDIATTRAEAAQLTHPALTAAATVSILNQDGWTHATDVLGKILSARERVKQKFDPIITPIYEGLQALYALRREIDGPLDDAETQVKGKMADFKRGELERERREKAGRQAEVDRISKEARDKEMEAERLRQEEDKAEANRKWAAESKAGRETAWEGMEQTTPATSSYDSLRQSQAAATNRAAAIKADMEARKLRQQADEAASLPITAPVTATGSSSRVKKTWKLVDVDALLAGVVAGKVPKEVVEVVAKNVNMHWKLHPEQVMGWPGIEIEDDVTIAGRRR